MDLEKSLLINIFGNEPNFRLAWDKGIRDEVFEDAVNKSVFRFTTDYWLKENTAKVPTQDVIEYEFPQFVFEENDGSRSVKWLIDALQGRYISNKTEEIVRTSAEKLSDGDEQGALRYMVDESIALRQQTLPRSSRSDFSTSVQERRERYAEAALHKENVNGAPLGFAEIDQHTFGIAPGELAVIGGYTGKGKSHILGHSAVAARIAGYTPLLITMELSVEEFETRLEGYHSGLPMQKIGRGTLDPNQLRQLHESQEKFSKLGPLYVENPEIGERTPERLVARARQLGADYLLIDQLSFMETKRTYQRVTDAYRELLLSLKSMIRDGTDEPLPCLLASQLNRASRTQKAERGQLENFADSALIEQTADIAMAIAQTREQKINKSVVLDLLKMRRGSTNSWLMRWDFEKETSMSVREELGYD